MHGSTEHIFSAPLADLRSFNCDSTVNNGKVQHLEAPGSKWKITGEQATVQLKAIAFVPKPK